MPGLKAWAALKEPGCYPADGIHMGAEGNVLIHTRMVCEALTADPEWQALSWRNRQSLFWAALLHDVAKPDCTRTGADGRIASPGHPRRGQIAARSILWRMGVPFEQREPICQSSHSNASGRSGSRMKSA